MDLISRCELSSSINWNQEMTSQISTRRSSRDNEPLTLALLTEHLNKLREDIKLDTTALIQELRNVITEQKQIIDSLKSTVIKQASELERLNCRERKEFAIINGVPENNQEAFDEVLDLLEADICPEYKPIRLGKNHPGKFRPLKIKFKTESAKIKSCKKANVLRSGIHTKRVYINYDYPPYTSKENARLRHKLKELKVTNPTHNYKIQNGKLLDNDTIIDHFDIQNQVFQ